MIAGMVPMALGWSEGGEQTAPLGRAVIGGLVAATLATLVVLPTVFAIVQGGAGRAVGVDRPRRSRELPLRPEPGQLRDAGLDNGQLAPCPGATADARTADQRAILAADRTSPRSQTMRQSIFRNLDRLAALVALATTTAGCGQATAVKADHAAGPAVTRVEVVKPERATIRRSTEEPGQIEAYEVTPIYAKVAGYVQKWNVDIGAKVKKGQVLAVLSVPELDAEAEQKMAMVEEAEAKLAQAKASEEVAQANLAGAQAKLAEVQAGIKRADADLARWQAEFKRVEQLLNERALTGSLLDETRSKLRSSESSREEVYAQVKTAEVGRPAEPGHARQGPLRRDGRRGEHQGRPVRRPARQGHARLRHDRRPLRRRDHAAQRRSSATSPSPAHRASPCSSWPATIWCGSP